MVWLIKYLIFGPCEHQWETMKQGPYESDNGLAMKRCEYRLLKCSKCGDWKKRII